MTTKEQTRLARARWWTKVWLSFWTATTIALYAVAACIWPWAAMLVQMRLADSVGPWAWNHWPLWVPRSVTVASAAHLSEAIQREHANVPAHIGTHIYIITIAPPVLAAVILTLAAVVIRRRRKALVVTDTADVRGAATVDGDELAKRLKGETR